MVSKRRSHSRVSRSGIFATIGILLAVALMAAGLWWDNQRNEAIVSRAASSSSLSDRTPTPLIPVDPETGAFASMADTVARLDDASQPLTIAVIGDSTGNNDDEWVSLTAERINREYGRTVVYNPWLPATTAYGAARTLQGAGEPVTIWNFSAPGERSAYSIRHLAVGVPEAPDLVIINHGHNETPAEAAGFISSLIDRVGEMRDPAPALAVTLQNPRLDELGIEPSQRISRAIAELTPEHPGAVTIDVRSAFEAADPSILTYPDGVHPAPAGSRLWADTVATALGLR